MYDGDDAYKEGTYHVVYTSKNATVGAALVSICIISISISISIISISISICIIIVLVLYILFFSYSIKCGPGLNWSKHLFRFGCVGKLAVSNENTEYFCLSFRVG